MVLLRPRRYIKWKSFRDTDDARYIGPAMPRVLGACRMARTLYRYAALTDVEQVKGPDHEKYLWTSASFSFASNMVNKFINNGWCVQYPRPAGGRGGERFAYSSVRSAPATR
ncbi:type VI secretion system contractile sheath domain-containing protein [Enterobacter hormaechei]